MTFAQWPKRSSLELDFYRDILTYLFTFSHSGLSITCLHNRREWKIEIIDLYSRANVLTQAVIEELLIQLNEFENNVT